MFYGAARKGFVVEACTEANKKRSCSKGFAQLALNCMIVVCVTLIAFSQ